MDKIALECARFIFYREGSKNSIRKTDIIKHLESTHNMPRSFHKEVIQKAEVILKNVYGYKLVSISDEAYIVILNEACDHKGLYDEEVRRLLIVTLTHIYMSGGTVTEDNLLLFLKQAHLFENYDYIKKILTKTFTKQLYLEYTKTTDGDENIFVFKWGKRAEHEIPKMLLLKKLSEALEQPPEYWRIQYDMAVAQKNEQTTEID